jgi:hypothetical protein
VTHALFLAAKVAARSRSVRKALIADDDVAAHAAGQIDDDVDLALPDALYYFAVVAGLHAERAGLRLAHVNVHDGRAGAAAATAAAAICSGVIGQCGLLVTLVSSPVMAQVMKTSWFMAALDGIPQACDAAAGKYYGYR